MSVSGEIARRLRAELDAHLQQGWELARSIGEDGRPPLVPVQRWHFTAQTLLRRGLIDDHPALVAFDRHCYYGLLSRARLEKAVTLFESTLPLIADQGMTFRLGFVREQLSSAVLASDEVPAAELRGALWGAAGSLATLAGLCGAGEHPAQGVICNRLTAAGLLQPELASRLLSADAGELRRAAAQLLDVLRLDS
ncbi:MAG TPA: hypothetical protein VHU83_23700 [Bryobacteraceae bacterium]|jgi:hypothetical protein|nr:hypothetical protein [Bryobacteraceae bacterium]